MEYFLNGAAGTSCAPSGTTASNKPMQAEVDCLDGAEGFAPEPASER